MPGLPIYKGALPWITVTLALAVASGILAKKTSSIPLLLLTILTTTLTLLLITFFRDPERRADPAEIAALGTSEPVLSPADGTITDITPTGGMVRIGIFMSPLDNHIQRNPLNGTAVSVEHSGSKFLAAFDPKARDVNVSVTLTARHATLGTYRVRQITGLLARRIRTWVTPHQPLHIGERLGMILLGSRVELELPQDKVTLKVALKSKVYAGTTIIATYDD
ncbi:MAG: phosphatidylserine decarboxylase [Elusimicrobiota bacterium]